MKYFLLIMITLLNLQAGNKIENNYDVKSSLFGTLGNISINIDEDSNKYKINMTVNTQGIASTMTNNRVENYESAGEIKNGVYVPTQFKKIKITDNVRRVQLYTFNHELKTIKHTKDIEKKVISSYFDVKEFKLKDKEEMVKTSKSEDLEEFYANDVLSSFLNIRKRLKSGQSLDTFEIKAIGAKQKEKLVNLKKTNPLISEYRLTISKKDDIDDNTQVKIVFNNSGDMKVMELEKYKFIGSIKANLKTQPAELAMN